MNMKPILVAAALLAGCGRPVEDTRPSSVRFLQARGYENIVITGREVVQIEAAPGWVYEVTNFSAVSPVTGNRVFAAYTEGIHLSSPPTRGTP